MPAPKFSYRRCGIVLAPDGSEYEAAGVLNPAITRDRTGNLLMFPRMVAPGNISRIGIARGDAGPEGPVFERTGIVLEPQTANEVRTEPGGYGCEDPRVTFIPRLDAYLMAYTAFGPQGPKVALAVSSDAYAWSRLGLIEFADAALNALPNKDAAFFPDIVTSPSGVPSFAFYHRPMLLESITGQAPIELMQSLPPEGREVTCIAYVHAEAALRDPQALISAAESVRVLEVGDTWGRLKNGCGTPPVKTPDGWLSLFHAVDARDRGDGQQSVYYHAGIVLHDLERPDRVLFRSPDPLLEPETGAERFGVVDDVVFPTGIDRLPGGGYDIYYGAADARIARAELRPVT